MLLRLGTSQFQFTYTFETGYLLSGILVGDFLPNAPQKVFNLRSLRAVCLAPQGNLIMSFDGVFGQFSLDQPTPLFSGSQNDHPSFFSFNYRDGEACIYDGTFNRWLTSGWHPLSWQVKVINPGRTPTLAAREETIAASLKPVPSSIRTHL